MAGYRSYGPLDDAPVPLGDMALVGVNGRLQPEQLPAGLAASAQNIRFRQGVAETRRGMMRPLWGQELQPAPDGKMVPRGWTNAHALGGFSDPDGLEWLLLAANDRIYKLRANGAPTPILQPKDVWCGPPVSFVQAFGLLFLLRGNHRATLVLNDLDEGWSRLWPLWISGHDYTDGDTVYYGPWTAELAGSLVRTGTEAVLTTALPHRLQTGCEVALGGPSLAPEFVGTYRITVLDGRSFSFQISAIGPSPALQPVSWTTHEHAWRAILDDPASPEPPGTSTPPKWERDYSVLPNGLNGTYLNGRLLVPTSWVPGLTEDEPASYGPRTDYVAASDRSNLGRFSVSREFRINQGAADELLALVKASARDVVCFKGRSILVLQNLSGDLSQLTLETLRSSYGLTGSRALASVGRDVVFASSGRGLCTLQQSANGEVMGVDIPLSDPVEPIIKRINWAMAERIRMAFWRNRLYVALPLDDGNARGRDLLAGLTRDTTGETVSVAGLLEPGQAYRWEPDPDWPAEYLEVSVATETAGEPRTNRFVAEGGPKNFIYGGGAAIVNLTPGLPNPQMAKGALRILRTDACNAILVFDYSAPVTPGDPPEWRRMHPVGQWTGLDEGPELAILEMRVATLWGREELICLTSDGWLSLYEYMEEMDVTRGVNAAGQHVIYEDIQSELVTRSYGPGALRWTQPVTATVAIGTWAPNYSIDLLADGVSEIRPARINVHRDPTRLLRPAWAARFNPYVAAAKHDQPWRDDYSIVGDPAEAALATVTFDSDRFTFDQGVTWDTSVYNPAPESIGVDVGIHGLLVDQLQESTEKLRLSALPGRSHQLRLANRAGRLELRGVSIEGVETSRAEQRNT